MTRWKKWPASARRFLAGAGGCSSLAFEGALRNRRFPKKVSKMFEKTRWMLQNHGRWCFFWRVNFAIRLPPLSFEAKSTLSQVVFPRQKAQPFPLKNHQQIHSKSKKYDYSMILSFASPQQMFPSFPSKVPIFFPSFLPSFFRHPLFRLEGAQNRQRQPGQRNGQREQQRQGRAHRDGSAARPNGNLGCLKGNIWECDRNISIEFRNIHRI